MGRELVRLLALEGCSVATCDVNRETLDETVAICAEQAPGVKVTAFVADVSDEAQVLAFRDHVEAEHGKLVHLLFNNAGIGGGGSFVADSRASWDKTFGVCWGGVYAGTRAFLPMMLGTDAGHVINTSSVNGFWASLGPEVAHTAYSAAKFAVKGFTEALVTDFRLNAPHLRASVVMPGHIGTSIAFNSGAAHGQDPKNLTDDQVARMRERLVARGMPVDKASDEDLRMLAIRQAEAFRDQAPTSAEQAAQIILDGVRAERWRILVGEDAHILDEEVRANPELAYEPEFRDRINERGALNRLRG